MNDTTKPQGTSAANERFAAPTLDFLREEVLPEWAAKNRRIEELRDTLSGKQRDLDSAQEEIERIRKELNGRPTAVELQAAVARVTALQAEIGALTQQVSDLEVALADRPQNPEQIRDLVREGWKAMIGEQASVA